MGVTPAYLYFFGGDYKFYLLFLPEEGIFNFWNQGHVDKIYKKNGLRMKGEKWSSVSHSYQRTYDRNNTISSKLYGGKKTGKNMLFLDKT